MSLTIHDAQWLEDLFEQALKPINLKLEAIMATQAEFTAAFERLNTATSNIAAVLNALRDQIAGLGLDATVEADILNKLGAAAGALEAMAQSPTDPVPVEPPPVEPPPTEPPVEPVP
jgi:hypothetical protein